MSSNPDSGYRSYSGHLFRPGMKAFEVGVKHAMLADNALEILGLYPNKRQKIMPPTPKQYGRSTRRSRITKKTMGKSKSIVKKTILSMAPTYMSQQNDSGLAQNMTMNNIYSSNITAKVLQGTTDSSRQGDEIYLTGLKVKGNFVTPTASNAYQYRVIVGWSGEEYNPGNFGSSGAGTGLNAAEIFLPLTGGQYATSSVINPKTLTVLYDQTMDLNSQLTGVSDIIGFDFYVPLSKKFAYQAAGSVYAKFKNLYIIIVSTVATLGTPLTTASGNVNVNTVLMYKNL